MSVKLHIKLLYLFSCTCSHSHAARTLWFLQQESVAELGEIPGPITAEGPDSVPGEKDLTQELSGQLEDETYKSRGYTVSRPKVRMSCHLYLLDVLPAQVSSEGQRGHRLEQKVT